MRRSSAAVIVAALCVFESGCSGGGGGSSTPNPTSPVPSSAPVVTRGPGSTTATPSTFTISSVPAGLGVTIVNGASTSNAVTPTTTTPPVSNLVTTITIAPNNGAPAFVFATDQRGDGNHTVLFNQLADTSGSLATVSTSSVARRSVSSAVANDGASLVRVRPSSFAGHPATSSTHLIVRYRTAALARAGVRAHDLEASAGAGEARDIGFESNGLATRVVAVPAGASIDTLAARLRAQPGVESAAPERLYYKETRTAQTTSDPRFASDNYEQWGLYLTGAPNAWGYTTGSSSVSVAVIDTGADLAHPDLAGKIVYGERILNGVTTAVNTAGNTATTTAIQDTDGHGTNVAGIAAADTNNGLGYAGMGYNTSLQVYKVFSDGTAANKYSTTANSSDVTQAIYDAVSHGAKVINLSLGSCQGLGADAMQQTAVNYAIAHNVVVVAAAGNERSGQGTDPSCMTASTVDFPAAYDGVISVGATSVTDTVPNVLTGATEHVASYSNSGPGLSLVAPGGDPSLADQNSTGTPDYLHWIAGLYTSTAADPTMQCKSTSYCAALFAGTSQATPFVSGAAALLFAANSGLSAAQVKTILTATADDLADPNQGSGRLDIYRALAAATGDPAPPQAPAKANFVAFAYVPNGTNRPQILDVTYPGGVPVKADGTFRVADIPANSPAYKIGVWYDANGDGAIDAGDYFGASTTTCTAAAPCTSAAGIVAHPVAAGFVP